MARGKAPVIASRHGIGGYGLLGDTRTAALVDEHGSIDWLCLPRFDGDPVFAALVAGVDGGHFRLGPADDAALVARRYRDGATVLETTWQVGGAQLVLTEGMVADVTGGLFPGLCLVRRFAARDGDVGVTSCFDPRFGTDRSPPTTRRELGALVCTSGATAVALAADHEAVLTPGRPVTFQLPAGSVVTVVLTAAHREPLVHVAPGDAWRALLDDEGRWRLWSSGIDFDGPGADQVRRSLVTLRLLTYSPSGAPVAAPTTSLPEELGGSRNWDYRYAWPRDASIGIGAFLGVGLVDQARAFLYWLLHATRLDRPRLRALLTLHGRRVPAERSVEAWPGYAGSRPVRFGNEARDQHQLDNYGWVLDGMWLLARAGDRLYGETWRMGIALAGHVADHWREPDAGIWEVRGDPAHYVHSKLMAWLALDRALRIARSHRTPRRHVERWATERAAIAAEVTTRGVVAGRATYTRAYGRRDLDAALLVLPLLDIEPPGSPRLLGTIDAVRRELSAGGPLLYRYPPGDDGLVGGEGAFLPCSFWLVQALAATGQVDDAIDAFEQLTGFAGPLGLLAEEADPATGQLLGNYPQALTHAALVQAALAIRDATAATTATTATAVTTPAAATAATAATTGRAATPAPRRTRRGRPS